MQPAQQTKLPGTPVKRVVIAGGGTAGWITAAVLSKCLGKQVDIQLIESEEIGTVGVGEATIPPLMFLHDVLEIEEPEFVRATQATFKLGISFENWRNVNEHYFHSFGKTGKSHWSAGFQHFWLEGKQRGLASDYGDYCLELRAGLDNRFATDAERSVCNYAYHFDATLYARYLRKYSEDLGVQRIEGKIAKVHTDPTTGFITGLAMEKGQLIEGDLFVDCTGIRSLLLSDTLGVEYEDWSHWLPCDTAVAVQTASVGEPVPYTRSIAHPWGWQWRIPLQHRVGNGIVFSSKHISPEDAKAALLANVQGEVLREPRFIKFTPGQRKEVWRANCVAIGLSSGFLEPLESTSIHLIQKGAMRLVELFPANGICQSDIDEYNLQARNAIEDIRDFIILHYKVTNRADSPFWDYCREMEIPKSLQHRIEQFRQTGRLINRLGELFGENSWVQVMMGQGITPKAHHPITRNMSNEALTDFLGEVRKDVARKMVKMPKHQAFINAYCKAEPPMEVSMPKPNVPAAVNVNGMRLRFNPKAKMKTVSLDGGAKVFVIDDFLENPEELVSLAEAVSPQFHFQAGHPYPGPQLLLPEDLSAQIDEFFQANCRERLGVKHPVGMYARFSRVVTDPSQLDPRQRVCHRDDTGIEHGHSMAALVHYLFKDEKLGGTVFFKSLMSPSQLHQFRLDTSGLDGASFAAKYGIEAGYMTDTNRYFERIGYVPGKWNRAVFYDGGILHSGNIQWDAERYHSGNGRLTVNAFFKHRNVMA